MSEDDTVVAFVRREPEPDDGTLNHFLDKIPGYPRKKCDHHRFYVDSINREVTCRDCNAIVQPFDALLAFSNKMTEFEKRYQARTKEAQELENWKPWLKAVRSLEQMWRGSMLPICPHCRKGIEAEELARSGGISRAIATRLREVESGRKNGEMKQSDPEVSDA